MSRLGLPKTILRGHGALVLAFALSACSLDARTLHPASGGGGDGAPSGSGGLSARAGSGSADGGLVDGCADLDTDGVADCTTTLLTNGSFAADVSDWLAGTDATLTWDPENALADTPSGSAKLSASTARASAFQCVPLSGSQLVIAYASVVVPVSSGGGGGVQAELEVSFFDDADCRGTRARYFETPPSTDAGVWVTVQAGGLSRDSTNSLSVALVGVKPFAASAFDVYFDNVMLKSRPP